MGRRLGGLPLPQFFEPFAIGRVVLGFLIRWQIVGG